MKVKLMPEWIKDVYRMFSYKFNYSNWTIKLEDNRLRCMSNRKYNELSIQQYINEINNA